MLPSSAARYAILQRSELQKFRRWSRLLHMTYEPAFLMAEVSLRRKGIESEFWGIVNQEYERLRTALPCSPKRILDIGCGIAGIDAILFRHYGGDPAIEFHLLDRTATDTLRPAYGFGLRGEFYNSLSVGRDVLVQNGVPFDQVHLIEAPFDGQIPLCQVDLALSLLSWGYHYPTSTYADSAARLLAPGGCLFLHIRKGTGGEADIRRLLGEGRVLAESPKWQLWSFKKTTP